MRKIESDDRSLESYLSIDSEIGILTIPFSQRPYEWKKSQVERLFNDLVGLYNADQEIHMLNFFTLSKEGGDTKIFDGQQRTITCLLIIGAFINKLDQLGQDQAANQLYNKYIIQVNYLSTSAETKQKLKFESPEIEFIFYELLERNNDKKFDENNSADPTIKNLIINYKTIQNLLTNFIEEHSLGVSELINLISAILDKTKLITIITYTDELAMAMFESLNNTGKQLENYYVLKNDLVIALGEDRVKADWNNIDSYLSSYDPSAFLLAVSTILTGKSTRKNSLERIYTVYDKTKTEDMESLLIYLLKASKKYLSIKNPVQYKINHNDPTYEEYKKLISNVGLFITSQHHPLILAMLINEVKLGEINKVLKHLLNLGVRNFYFKEKSANTIEVPIAKITNDFYTKDILDIDQVIQSIKKLFINDDELKDAILAKNVKPTAERKLKFILRETYNNKDLDKELEIRDSLDKIHLEHILPKNPNNNSQWLVDFKDDDERELYTNKIGNLTLLLGKINRTISNKDFNSKVNEYKSSHIPENHRIAQKNKWTKDEINSRTKSTSAKIREYLNTLLLN